MFNANVNAAVSSLTDWRVLWFFSYNIDIVSHFIFINFINEYFLSIYFRTSIMSFTDIRDTHALRVNVNGTRNLLNLICFN